MPATEAAYFGVAVSKHPLRSDLLGWQNSNRLLAAICQREFGMPASRVQTLENPDARQLYAGLQRFLNTLDGEGPLVVYIGTHHDGDGVLRLHRDQTTYLRLFELLQQSKRQVLLVADICHAGALEALQPGETITRLYASDGKEQAPEVNLDGSFRAMASAFAPVRQNAHLLLVSGQRLSWLGALVAQSWLKQQALDVATTLDHVPALARSIKKATKQTRFPIPFTPQPHQTPVNVHLTELERLLEQDHIDHLEAVLLIAQIHDPGVRPEIFRIRVDHMASTIAKRIGKTKRPDTVIAKMNNYLFGQEGFQAERQPYTQDFLLDRLLSDGRGRCAGLVSLYLALGQKLDLPLAAVCVPEHIYVQWNSRLPSKQQYRKPLFSGHVERNIETTRQGQTVESKHYQHIVARAEGLGLALYQRPLTQREAIGTLLSPLANALREQKRIAEGIAAARLATRINPDDAEAWNNLGLLHRRNGTKELALASFHRALKLLPGLAEAHNNLGVMAETTEDAVFHFKDAIRYKPHLEPAWRNLGVAYQLLNQHDRAEACFARSRALRHPVSPQVPKE